MFLKILGGFLNVSLCTFSFIIPKKKGLILFGSSHGEAFRGSPKYLYMYRYKYLNREKSFWITRNKKVSQDLNYKRYPCLYVYSIKAFWYILRSEYIVVDSTSSKDFSYINRIFGKFDLIQTWHGTPMKKIGIGHHIARGRNRRFNLFFLELQFKMYFFVTATSKEVAKRLSVAFLNNNIKIIGSPRNDVLFDKKFLFNDLDKRLGFSEYSKIVAYLPTWRDTKLKTKPFTKNGLIKFNDYLKKNNALFIFKKHALEKNIPDLSGFSNIKDFSCEIEDVQELLIYTDILISDYSGVIFDFSLLDKPIIFYPYDKEEYLKDCRDMYYDYYDEVPGPFANNETELLDLIKYSDKWFKQIKYQKEFIKFKERFNKFHDGDSSKRFFEVLDKESGGL